MFRALSQWRTSKPNQGKFDPPRRATVSILPLNTDQVSGEFRYMSYSLAERRLWLAPVGAHRFEQLFAVVDRDLGLPDHIIVSPAQMDALLDAVQNPSVRVNVFPNDSRDEHEAEFGFRENVPGVNHPVWTRLAA